MTSNQEQINMNNANRHNLWDDTKNFYVKVPDDAKFSLPVFSNNKMCLKPVSELPKNE